MEIFSVIYCQEVARRQDSLLGVNVSILGYHPHPFPCQQICDHHWAERILFIYLFIFLLNFRLQTNQKLKLMTFLPNETALNQLLHHATILSRREFHAIHYTLKSVVAQPFFLISPIFLSTNLRS